MGDGDVDGEVVVIGELPSPLGAPAVVVVVPPPSPLAVEVGEAPVLSAFFRSDSGLNGSRWEKVSSFEPCVGESSTFTAGSVSSFGAGVATTGAAVGSDAGLSITTGMAI